VTPGLLTLEPRDCPAVDAGAGNVFVAQGVVRHCFEDAWSGPLNVYDPGGDRVYVGAGEGGGPRVQVYGRDGALLRDFFAGDPGSRAGVYFVPADPPPPEQVTAPRLTYGDPASEYTVFVDAEERLDPRWLEDAHALLGPAGVALTTVRPDRPAGTYGTVVLGAPLSFVASAGGLTPWVGYWLARSSPYEERPVYVSPAAGGNTGVALAHEVGHALGLAHVADPSNVMYPAAGPGRRFDPGQLDALRAAAAALADLGPGG
jgi:hypothetical protein